MPLTYELDKRLVRIRAQGQVEYNSGLSVLKAALQAARKSSEPKGEVLWDFLLDLRESKENRSDVEIQGIAMAMAQNMDILTGRMAIVVIDPSLVGRAEMFSAFAEKLGQHPHIFATPEEAEAWLAG
jgi:hypothetical protein